MRRWRLHWLTASGTLDDHRRAIIAAMQVAYDALSSLMVPPELDILIERRNGRTIPEIGVSGRAYRANLFALSCDPDNLHFAGSLLNGALSRTIVHEVHHCLRMGGPGYGRTLCEALVSEGLAGHFVRHLLQSQPEPWETAVALPALKSLNIRKSVLSETRYDHSYWFFGTGSLPRWLGYTLGYEIVGQWLIANTVDAAAWINVAAGIPVEAAIASGLIAPD